MPKISVIVPVYKVEKYLSNCIESILHQTYTDFELVLVDDGSPDLCPTICDNYAKLDSRIIVIHKKNGGLSDARNTGLANASGDYIMFVDSDDFIAPEALALTLDCCERNNADITITTKITTFSDTITPTPASLHSEVVMTNHEALEYIFTKISRWEACGSLFKRSLFDGISFPVGKIYEDIGTTSRLVIASNAVCFAEACIYYYLKRIDSIMGQSKAVVKIDLLDVCSDLISYIEQKLPDCQIRTNIIAGILYELVSRVDLAKSNRKGNAVFIHKALQYARGKAKYISKCTKPNKKIKLYCRFQIYYGRWIWVFAHNIKKLFSK